jgi:hypothetical protein
LPEPEAVDQYLEQIRESFPAGSNFDEELRAYDLTEATLRDHLALQLTTLRFVEYRFKPDTAVSEADIDDYYQHQISSWKSQHPGTTPPALGLSRQSIRKDLIAAHTDEVLDAWLEESRRQLTIVYLDHSLQ